ncbi:MAG: SpoIIE family protein phosphatase [Ignavibacteriaceae bacterium]|nr:SpoIIE family protein phosphatase [Ignavibacteriaceae bacterium]
MIPTDITKIKRNLTALVEFSRIVNSSHDLEFTLNNLLLSCFGKFLVTKGLVALSKNDEVKVFASKGISSEILKKFPPIQSTVDAKGSDESLIQFQSYSGLNLCQEICSSRGCLGIILLGEKINKSDYSEEELDFLKTLLNISATAIENSIFIDELKLVNRNLDSRVNRLSSLFELSKEFGILESEQRISKLLLYSLLGHFMISNYAIVLFENQNIQLLEHTIPAENIEHYIKSYNLWQLTENLTKHELSRSFKDIIKDGIEICIPMKLQGVTKGIVLLGRRLNNVDYNSADIEFVSSVASIAIVSLENKRLFQEALLKQKLEEELEIAKDIQQKLLPSKIPSFENFEIASLSVSSKQVGGDYYDIIVKNSESFIVSIADVSGKGVPASLLMANLQAVLKAVSRQDLAIDEATGLINDLITENTSDGRFITFFWGIINDKTKNIKYVNAGHNPPILIRNKKIQKLERGGLILGVVKTFAPYLFEEIQLKSGDVLVLFTDGITEAKNNFDEDFSDERFEKLLHDYSSLSPSEIINKVENEISKFTIGEQQSDDITLVVIKVK